MKAFPLSIKPAEAGRWAFTLLELLISLVLIGVLASLLMVGMSHLRQAGQRTTSINDLRASAMSLLTMANDESGMLKVWLGGTAGTAGAWPSKLFSKGYVTDTRVFYGTPKLAGIERPAPNWYLYTWGMNMDDPRAAQRINGVSEGYQIRLSAIDNPAATMLLADSIIISSATAKDNPPRQTFRILMRTGVDNGTSSGLRARDGRTVLMAFFDGRVEQANFARLYELGFRRVIDESGRIVTLPLP